MPQPTFGADAGAQYAPMVGGGVASIVVKPSSGVLYNFQVFNGAGAANFIQIFDATSLPANTTVPTLAPIPIAASTAAFIDLGIKGVVFTNGIVIAKSTTALTLTAGAADGGFSAGYK